MLIRITGAIFALATVACSAPDKSAVLPAGRDSAGIRIVTSDAPTTTWTVDSAPSIVIADDGTPATKKAVFGRIVGAARTRDGGIVVVDQKEIEIRYFDAQGRFVRAAARKGDGPGEFQRPMGLLRVSDGYLVTDLRGRNAVYDDDGKLVREVSILMTSPFATLGNGLLLAQGGFADAGEAWTFVGAGSSGEAFVPSPGGGFSAAGVTFTPPPPPVAKTVVVDSEPITTYQRDGAKGDTVGVFPTLMRGGDSTTWTRLRFAPAGLFAAAGTRFYSAFGSRAEVTVREGKQVLAIARWPVPTAAVGKAERDEIRRIELITSTGGSFPEPERSAHIAEVEAELLPDSLPRFAEMRADPDGNVWLRRYQVAEGLSHPWVRPKRAPEEWHVLTPDGVWLATVKTPADVRVLEIGTDYIIGVARDADDVESVRQYSLRRK
jgi:hypothetical protein